MGEFRFHRLARALPHGLPGIKSNHFKEPSGFSIVLKITLTSDTVISSFVALSPFISFHQVPWRKPL
jgi:hypothetical protein